MSSEETGAPGGAALSQARSMVRWLCAALVIASAAGVVSVDQASAATAKRAPSQPLFRLTPLKGALVPVLAELGGASAGQRLVGAEVRVYALSAVRAPRGRRGDKRGGTAKRSARLVGRGTTGLRGVALVRLSQKAAPRLLRVRVSGGRVGGPRGPRFRGTLLTQLRYRAPHAVYVSPPSTLVAVDQIRHPRRSLAASKARAYRTLGIPRWANLTIDLASPVVFDGRAFVRAASRGGGFDRYVARLVTRGRRAPAKKSADPTSCWTNAAATTAGFAQFVGFKGVPNPPSVCSLTVAAGSTAAQTSQVAVVTGVIKAVASVGKLAYKIFSGHKQKSEISGLRADISTIESDLNQIIATLTGLESAVAAVGEDVDNSSISSLSASAAPTINAIDTATADVHVLLNEAFQVLCPGGPATCASIARYGNFSDAMDAVCDDWTDACNDFYWSVISTADVLQDSKPAEAVENLSDWALGSAGTGGPQEAGVVQYSLQEAASGKPYFQTGDAAAARMQWAYYAFAGLQAQSTYALTLSMAIGVQKPGANTKHAPVLTTTQVVRGSATIDPTIDVFMGAFPNMPDTAVVVTNDEATGAMANDPPTMFAQQVGALADIGAYMGKIPLLVSPANVQAGRLTASNGSGAFLTTQQTTAAPPLVLTPAAADGTTWQLLPASGRSPLAPTVSVGYFGDWTNAQALLQAGVLPQWDASSTTVTASSGGLYGPLADLYGSAAPTGSQTAGQWVTQNAGIDDALLTPQGTGYANTSTYGGFSGVVPYYQQSGTDSASPGLGFTGCTPAGDSQCLLPTWLTTSSNPYAQVTAGTSYNSGSTQIITGLYDFNNGLVIDNQQGHSQNSAPGFTTGSVPGNPGSWLNQYPNWASATTLRGVPFNGFLDALDGAVQGGLQNAGFNTKGRPVLLNRAQAGSDCFWWNGATGSNAAAGTGCLTRRTKSGQILPGG